MISDWRFTIVFDLVEQLLPKEYQVDEVLSKKTITQ
jgi:hypothetical protein